MKSSAAEAVRLFQSGRADEAERAARALLDADARNADALHLLGCIRAQAGAREEAVAFFDQALAVDPRHPAFLINRGRVLIEAGRPADAARDLQLALQVMPASPAAQSQRAMLHNLLGVALQREGRAQEAIAHLGQALAMDPALTGALVNWGNALETLGDLAGAREKFQEATTRNPQAVQAWQNTASVAVDLGDYAAARAAYGRALELNPSFTDARYGLGLVDLREKRFADGWDGFELRFVTDPPQSVARGPRLPPLEREDLGKDKRVAVWSEQGIGDQVLFSTLLPGLRDAGCRVVAEVDARLLAAYQRSIPGIDFVASGATGAFASCERQLALGSLPRFLRRDEESFSRQPQALLRADPARVESIRAQLGGGRHIAVSWRSLQRATRAARAARKSAPLEPFAALAQARGARLLDIQYGDVREERDEFERRHPGMLVRVPGLDAFSDLEGVMAAIVACGEVVTVSNVVAHLAGALGVRASVIFPGGVAPFHYWDAVRGPQSLWYPSLRVESDRRWVSWEQAFAALSAGNDR